MDVIIVLPGVKVSRAEHTVWHRVTPADTTCSWHCHQPTFINSNLENLNNFLTQMSLIISQSKQLSLNLKIN